MRNLMILLIIFLSACSSLNSNQPTATITPTEIKKPTATTPSTFTPSPSNTNLPTDTQVVHECIIDNDFLTKLKDVVPYDDFYLYHNIIGGIHTLAVWYIDPEIDIQVSAETLESELTGVIERATELGIALYDVDPCVGQTFTGFNPVVVDAGYNGWFSGLLYSEDIIEGAGDVSDLVNSYFQPYHISFVPEPVGDIPEGRCTWEETEEKLWHHFSRERENVSFYFVYDLNGYNVWVQWDGMGLLPLETASILNVTMELDCLYPTPDNLIVMVVGEDGYAYLVGLIISNDGEFRLEDMRVIVGE
jgi:hypothetical protein